MDNFINYKKLWFLNCEVGMGGEHLSYALSNTCEDMFSHRLLSNKCMPEVNKTVVETNVSAAWLDEDDNSTVYKTLDDLLQRIQRNREEIENNQAIINEVLNENKIFVCKAHLYNSSIFRILPYVRFIYLIDEDQESAEETHLLRYLKIKQFKENNHGLEPNVVLNGELNSIIDECNYDNIIMLTTKEMLSGKIVEDRLGITLHIEKYNQLMKEWKARNLKLIEEFKN